MAAEITLFAAVGSGNDPRAQVPLDPIASYSATFTPAQNGVIRVYANGAAVALTIDGIAFTVPSGTVERFGVRSGKEVTVA